MIVLVSSAFTILKSGLTIHQLTEYVENWIRNNHVPFPRAGEPELTLMEEKALREEAERAVGQVYPLLVNY
jgi:hypothetical protein